MNQHILFALVAFCICLIHCLVASVDLKAQTTWRNMLITVVIAVVLYLIGLFATGKLA
jgi:hypothetical protein